LVEVPLVKFGRMTDPDPYASWSLSDRLELLAFEAELVAFPRSRGNLESLG
jgi:hypothetical protein